MAYPLYEMDAAIQLSLDGGSAFLLMATVMYGKRQSDHQEHNCENFVIGHDHHPLLWKRGLKPSAIFFLPAGEPRGSMGIITSIDAACQIYVSNPTHAGWPAPRQEDREKI